MKKTLFISLLAFGLSTAFGPAFAAPDAALPLYDGQTLAQDKLAVSDWGGGSVEDSTQLFLFGGHSLKVTTLDLYQGAKVSFLNPVALTGSNHIFQVTLKRGDVTLHYDPQTVPGEVQSGPQNTPGFNPGGYPGGYPGGSPGGYPGNFGGRGGRGRGRGGFGNRFGNQRRANPAPLIPLISRLRLEFTLADGRKADVVEPIPETVDAVAGDGWYSVNVPISSLKFGTGSNTQLQSVTLAGDQYGVFFVGRMQIAPEPTAAEKAASDKASKAPAATEEDPGQAMDGGFSFPPPGGE